MAQILSYRQLSNVEKKLIDAAEKAIKNAYNPYSKSFVGAAVLTQSGKIIPGACFANSSSSVNACAEKAAVMAANSLGYRRIKALAIIAKNKNLHDPITPCGVCRQFLFEITKITGHDLIILGSNPSKTKIIKTSIYELLPYPYSRYK